MQVITVCIEQVFILYIADESVRSENYTIPPEVIAKERKESYKGTERCEWWSY